MRQLFRCIGIAVGCIVSCCLAQVAPTVTTTSASSIAAFGATAGGAVANNGGASVTSEGVCYSTSPSPTTPCTSDGTASPFTSSLANLLSGSVYYYRAFAINSAGTGYGTTLTFSTSHSVVLAWVWTQGSGGSADGFKVYSSSVSGGPYTQIGTVLGATSTAYIDSSASVVAGTLYYVVTAYNSTDESSYSNESVASIPAGIVVPAVDTVAVSSVSNTAAIAGGIVQSNEGASVTAEGTCYALTINPTTPCTSDGTGRPFTSSLSGLTPGTVYHYRAFATNSAGTGYGTDQTFMTGTGTTIEGPVVTAGSIVIH